MRDRVGILAGLAVFLALITVPMWKSLATGRNTQPPNIVLPASQKDCILPPGQMRAAHMKLLLDWRNDVVRNDIHTFKAYDGKVYNISLSGTCLKCHNKAQFCDRCHNYAGVRTPSCWDCHLDPASLAGGPK